MRSVLEAYFVKYLKEVRGVSDSSVGHYKESLRYISKILVNKGLTSTDIYEIGEYSELEKAAGILKSDAEFVTVDERGHRMYSSGLNNYLRFAKGTDFAGIHEKVKLLDMVIPIGDAQYTVVEGWKRSPIIKKQSLEAAGYLCEVFGGHNTFKVKNENHQYMEGHHLVPMKKQDAFSCSLDVYANVICLCPLCHRFLHYAEPEEKENVINKLYSERADRLAVSGIQVSREELLLLAQ